MKKMQNETPNKSFNRFGSGDSDKRPTSWRDQNKTFVKVLWVSLGLHVLFFASAILFTGLWPSSPDYSLPGPISVEMVSLSGSAPLATLTTEEKAILTDEPIPEKTPPVPVKEETVVIPEEKPPLVTPEKKEDVKTPPKTSPPPPPQKNTVLSALDALDDMPTKKAAKNGGQGEGAGSGTYLGKGAGAGSGDGRPLTLEDLYRLDIAKRVEQKWSVSDQLVGRKKLVVEMRFQVKSNGDLGEIWIDKKSGNTVFDESAERAVKKAAPFPEHPEGVTKSNVIVPLRFTPEGITDIRR